MTLLFSQLSTILAYPPSCMHETLHKRCSSIYIDLRYEKLESSNLDKPIYIIRLFN